MSHAPGLLSKRNIVRRVSYLPQCKRKIQSLAVSVLYIAFCNVCIIMCTLSDMVCLLEVALLLMI